MIPAKLVLTLAIVMALLCPRAARAADPRPAEVAAMSAAVEAVCPLIEQEAGLESEIALERRNPADVVSLRRLHELGALLQFTRAELARERFEHHEGLRLFARWAGKSVDLGFCEAHRRAHEG